MVEIRKYKPSDIVQLTELMTDLGCPSSLEEMKVRMERIELNSNYFTFVATLNDTVVGMIGITLHHTYTNNNVKTQITSLVTKKEFRGQGIAKKLVKYIEEWSHSKGSNFIYLLSGNSEKRINAHALYKYLGFEITGYRFVKNL
ncbi:GNAT family N-acetyltransferase [Terrilactibacillus laevilacticus]|uniref:GNAT family N-acetyltransferase n=1 Tax=Terrilactibacillus laevilacticus TaxID=1380157 RepID=A0ABW5PUZ0_9BACI|nr:GNAT family N-acetyltransferase [Terrilactibacillus laevilacticus]